MVFMKCIFFDCRKSLQALYYLYSKSGINDKLSLLKLIFFADRYHIRNYGIPMLQDNYCAMQLGPVCSQTYDLIKKGRYYDALEIDDKKYIDNFLFCNGDIVDIKDTGEDDLSESDREALDFSVKIFSKFSLYEISEITHAYPEWSKFKILFDAHKTVSENMDYIDFFDNPEKENEYILKYFDGKDPFADNENILKAMKAEYCSKR